MGPLPAAQTLTNISKSDQKAKERCLNLSSKKLNQFESISPVCLSCHGLFMKVSGGFACEHIKIVDTVKCNVHFCPFRSVVQSSDGRSIYIYIYATPPPRDLPFQNVLVPPQGDMTTRFSLLHNYMPPRTCTLNLVGLTCIEVTSLVAERSVVIQDCFLEYSSSCYIVSIEVF